jgi:hypothetical protein
MKIETDPLLSRSPVVLLPWPTKSQQARVPRSQRWRIQTATALIAVGAVMVVATALPASHRPPARLAPVLVGAPAGQSVLIPDLSPPSRSIAMIPRGEGGPSSSSASGHKAGRRSASRTMPPSGPR